MIPARSRIAFARQRFGRTLEARLVPASPTRRLRSLRVLDEIADLPEDGIRVLDVGCGDGFLVSEIARRHPAWHVVGVDLAEDLVTRARRSVGALELSNVEFRRADATVGLGQAEFDVVVLLEYLTEVTVDRRALEVGVAALRAGGLFIAQVPAEDWEPVLPFGERTWRHEVRHGYRHDELLRLLTESGLTSIALRPSDHALVRVAQESVDQLRRHTTAIRALVHPLSLAAVGLERTGVTFGRSRSIFVTARRATSTG